MGAQGSTTDGRHAHCRRRHRLHRHDTGAPRPPSSDRAAVPPPAAPPSRRRARPKQAPPHDRRAADGRHAHCQRRHRLHWHDTGAPRPPSNGKAAVTRHQRHPAAAARGRRKALPGPLTRSAGAVRPAASREAVVGCTTDTSSTTTGCDCDCNAAALRQGCSWTVGSPRRKHHRTGRTSASPSGKTAVQETAVHRDGTAGPRQQREARKEEGRADGALRTRSRGGAMRVVRRGAGAHRRRIDGGQGHVATEGAVFNVSAS